MKGVAFRAVVAISLVGCGGTGRGVDDPTTVTVTAVSASAVASVSASPPTRAPECVGAAMVEGCHGGDRESCLAASDLAFTGCDFAEDDLGVDLVKRACDLGAPRACLTYGTLLFTRLPSPHQRPDADQGRILLATLCDGAKPGMPKDEAEARRAACDRLSVRLQAAGNADWETFATKACNLGRVDACVRLAAKTKGAPYLAELTKLCLKPDVGQTDLVGAPLEERERDPNGLLRACVEVLSKREASFETTPDGKAARARAQSLDRGLLDFYLGNDATDVGRRGSNASYACSSGDDQACTLSPGGDIGSGTCTLLTPEACANWANALLTPNGTDDTWHPRAERIATRACELDDRTCGTLGRVLRVVRPNETMHAKDAFSRACRAGNPAACKEGDQR